MCITGQGAAQEFYQEGRFIRRGAIPSSVLRLLQDKGSVATLDGPEHHWRKQLFMSLMQPQAIERVADIVGELWLAALNQWKTKDEIIFLDEVEKILLHAVCIWTGIPLTKADIIQRTKEISAMIEGAGAVGPKNWKGIWLRRKTERWARHLINQSRAATPTMNASVLSKVAHHRTAKGELLSSEVAAVELLNILRPTVAIGRYGLFAALALHQFPACRNEIVEKNNSEYIHYFVQEVRRYYPFFPFIGGLVNEEFKWRSYHFKRGERVLLDLYGTNHDPRLWDKPQEFNPERFRNWNNKDAFSLIPQGGGDFTSNHRCAGEWLTIALLQRMVILLTQRMSYEVKSGDLQIDNSRMPAHPRTPLILYNVHKRS